MHVYRIASATLASTDVNTKNQVSDVAPRCVQEHCFSNATTVIIHAALLDTTDLNILMPTSGYEYRLRNMGLVGGLRSRSHSEIQRREVDNIPPRLGLV